MPTNAQREAIKKWKKNNSDKIREQRKRYRLKYPEKIKEHNIKYLDKKFKNNPEYIAKLEGQIRADFGKLTRLLFNDILPKKCFNCGCFEELEIHHEKYAYPILESDLKRLCKKCHFEQHHKI